jgi:DNA-binding transcriptional LysR family regulator
MSDVETRLFRYFVAVAEELHFTRAAERLGITPPTLTQQIQKLESQLGVKLLRRKGNTKVVITEAGQRFLTDTREALRHVEQATLRARQAGRGELGRLRIGFLTLLPGAGLLEDWTTAFREAHPAIHMMMRKMSPMAQIAGIARNEMDAGFTRPPHKYPPGVRGFTIYRQPLVLALPSKHPLARHKAISPAMLAPEPFVSTTIELDMGFFGYTEAIARIGNFTARVVERQDDFMAVLAYVALRHGIAVVPELLKTMNLSNVVFRDIAADRAPHASIAFVYGSDPSPSTKLLIWHMQRHALQNGGKGAAPRHSQDRVPITTTLNVDRHPEVLACRASLEGCSPSVSAVALRGSLRSHLRVTGMTQ